MYKYTKVSKNQVKNYYFFEYCKATVKWQQEGTKY